MSLLKTVQKLGLFYRKPSQLTAAFRLTSMPNKIQDTETSYSNSYINQIFKRYEDIIGLTDVKVAQNRVIQAEKKFGDTQELRRERQRDIQQLQAKLKEIHLELDKTIRGEDRYLQLVTQEHTIIRQERSLLKEFNNLEKDERDFFSALSLAVRESHEQERAQAERTKYWSLIGSVCGAIIGIVGTTINNRLRMKELRELVQDSALAGDAKHILLQQQQKVDNFLTDLRQLVNHETGIVGEHKTNSELSQALEGVVTKLSKETQELKVLLTSQLISNPDDNNIQGPVSVYIGQDLEHIVHKAEKNLEWKMKVNSLATVAAFYGLFAITVPLILQMFKGS